MQLLIAVYMETLFKSCQCLCRHTCQRLQALEHTACCWFEKAGTLRWSCFPLLLGRHRHSSCPTSSKSMSHAVMGLCCGYWWWVVHVDVGFKLQLSHSERLLQLLLLFPSTLSATKPPCAVTSLPPKIIWLSLTTFISSGAIYRENLCQNRSKRITGYEDGEALEKESSISESS